MRNSIKIISEKFKTTNDKEVEALTILLEGRNKRMFDIIKEEKGYSTNSEVLRVIIEIGIINLIKN